MPTMTSMRVPEMNTHESSESRKGTTTRNAQEGGWHLQQGHETTTCGNVVHKVRTHRKVLYVGTYLNPSSGPFPIVTW